MANDPRMDALELALKNETTERKFYLDNGSRTKNPLGKAMFLQIADDELEHYERLKEIHKIWSEKGKWPETLTVNMTKVRGVIRDLKGKGPGTPAAAPADSDDLKAVQTAIEFEANGAAFYAALRDRCDDPKEREFFNLLADIEHEHFVSLLDAEEFLRDPVGWYRRTERHSLDGA
ncbi:MAG: ferritin family protein [Syntrophaceae bacterium]